ncbi:MAG: hypothetical protein ABII10_01910 [Candidatus Paceibacterota bacterium]
MSEFKETNKFGLEAEKLRKQDLPSGESIGINQPEITTNLDQITALHNPDQPDSLNPKLAAEAKRVELHKHLEKKGVKAATYDYLKNMPTTLLGKLFWQSLINGLMKKNERDRQQTIEKIEKNQNDIISSADLAKIVEVRRIEAGMIKQIAIGIAIKDYADQHPGKNIDLNADLHKLGCDPTFVAKHLNSEHLTRAKNFFDKKIEKLIANTNQGNIDYVEAIKNVLLDPESLLASGCLYAQGYV